jgi:hypothetical protein
VPTLAVIVAFVRNETASAALSTRISNLETRLDARIETLDRDLRARLETLDRDLRDWAKITMAHNTDIARLKDKTGMD